MPFSLFCLYLGICSFTLANLSPRILSNEDQKLLQLSNVPEEPVSKSLYLFSKEDLSNAGKALFSLFSKIYAEIKNDHFFRIPT
jgi:hypothetical protein